MMTSNNVPMSGHTPGTTPVMLTTGWGDGQSLSWSHSMSCVSSESDNDDDNDDDYDNDNDNDDDDVTDAPEVETDHDWIHCGEGRSVTLVCRVYANPVARVSRSRIFVSAQFAFIISL